MLLSVCVASTIWLVAEIEQSAAEVRNPNDFESKVRDRIKFDLASPERASSRSGTPSWPIK